MYNGWRNYETWAANLWLGSGDTKDPYASESLSHELQDVMSSYEMDYARGEKIVRRYVESEMPELGASLADDLLNSAKSEIDYREIATAWMDDLDAERSAV